MFKEQVRVSVARVAGGEAREIDQGHTQHFVGHGQDLRYSSIIMGSCQYSTNIS
jgi:hypothetical protein